MGVHGLWRLIEPSGKPVPLETLENKVLAVDVSIWLHQAIKGFQDHKGNSMPNAHLLGVYHRLCKLLYYRIRPVFVFDGGVPVLKKQTIAKRKQLKNNYEDESARIHQQILSSLIKHTAINTVLMEKPIIKISPKKPAVAEEDLFKLPPLPEKLDSTQDDSDDSDYSTSTEDSSPCRHSRMIDIDTVDPKSQQFKSLPPDVRLDILTEIKENSKMTSRRKLLEMDAVSGAFSVFQINRVLKRRSIQVSLEEAEKEMGGHSLSLGELETLLKEEGIVTASEAVANRRIASDEKTRFLLIKDLQKAIKTAKLEAEEKEKLNAEQETAVEYTDLCEPSTSSAAVQPVPKSDYERELEAAVAMSLEESGGGQPEVATNPPQPSFAYLENFNDGDFVSDASSEEEFEVPKSSNSLAKAYLTEYTDFTPTEIETFLGGKNDRNVNPKDFYMHEMKLDIPKNKQANRIIEINERSSYKSISAPTEKSAENCQIEASTITVSDDNSDSSDDFVEVTEEKPEIKIPNVVKSSLEIVIDPKTEIENDLFADVFELNHDATKPVANPEERIQLITDNVLPPAQIEENSIKTPEKIPENSLLKEVLDEISSLESKTLAKTDDENSSSDLCLESGINESSHLTPKKKTASKDLEASPKVQDDSNLQRVEVKRSVPKISTEQLNIIKERLETEQETLVKNMAHQDRMANSITDNMYKDTQELLELFGIPYIIAPMEAEAQCAYLDDINLTDGTITDDSDIWLFGGKTVYKNFFNQKKHVLEFKADSIQHHFKLTRHQLIMLALLVGSDYTLGIQGVGPVTALEILAAFPPNTKEETPSNPDQHLVTGLSQFKNWWRSGRVVGPGKTSLRNKLKNITLSEGFPNKQVVMAYLRPEVETSKETFTWGKPNIESLIHFARTKFGWSELKANEVLRPVIKKLEDPNSQKSILAYFQSRPVIQPDTSQLSKRVQKAIKRIDSKNISDSDDEPQPKQVRKRNLKPADIASSSSSSQAASSSQKTKPKRVRKAAGPKVVTVDLDVKPLTKITQKIQAAEDARRNKEKYQEVIPQREKDRLNALKTKLKAIEMYRKSKQGPGFVEKKPKIQRPLKDEAELSENSSDD